ncbi:MAG: DUF420 domain-containing protein [Spirochaetia bacterium]|nr:DUF420 domain-containing protein [Spirochaetia bacterium]
MDIKELPFIFSCMNAVSFVSIVIAFILIKAGNKTGHRIFMGIALLASAGFLAMYLFYHYNTTEPVHFQAQGLIRYIYFTILITHTILAVIIVPFIIKTVYHAIKDQPEKHKKLARWVLPVWCYVSFTGVVIYIMLFKITFE